MTGRPASHFRRFAPPLPTAHHGPFPRPFSDLSFSSFPPGTHHGSCNHLQHCPSSLRAAQPQSFVDTALWFVIPARSASLGAAFSVLGWLYGLKSSTDLCVCLSHSGKTINPAHHHQTHASTVISAPAPDQKLASSTPSSTLSATSPSTNTPETMSTEVSLSVGVYSLERSIYPTPLLSRAHGEPAPHIPVCPVCPGPSLFSRCSGPCLL